MLSGNVSTVLAGEAHERCKNCVYSYSNDSQYSGRVTHLNTNLIPRLPLFLPSVCIHGNTVGVEGCMAHRL